MSSKQDLVPSETRLFNATRASSARRDKRTTVIKDHEGGDVSLTWFPFGKRTSSRLKSIPALAYQVYIINSAVECSASVQVLDQFCAVIYDLYAKGSRFHPDHRFDIYQTIQENYLACAEHQRKEVQWRNRNGVEPRLVSTWSTSGQGGDKAFILVIDSVDIVKHGISLVYFDPDEYDDPIKRRRVWHLPGNLGDFDLVRGIKVRTRLSLIHWLSWSGRNASLEGPSTDLRLRSEGSSSRALHPAGEPPVYDHAETNEDEGDELFNLEQQVGDAVDETTDNSSKGEHLQPNERPQIIDCFRRNELWTLPRLGAKRYGMATYEDSQSQCTVSVWDSTLSATRPHFSITLYCGSAATFPAESLFRCLNKGLIRNQPWTLDVKRGFDSLSQGHLHHGREASRRTFSRLSRRSSCMRMLVRNIVAGKLPVELCDTIEQLLVPPTIPDYACSPLKPFHDLMLYFAPKSLARSLSQGPLLVFSNPSSLLSANGVQGTTNRPTVKAPDTVELRVKNLRFWHWVADEIHTLASLCAPEDRDCPQLECTPSATISIDSPLWSGNLRQSDRVALITLRVESTQTLTLHTRGLFSQDLFFEALQLVDLTANRVLPQLSYEDDYRHTLNYDDSWSTSARLGLSNQADAPSRLKRLEVLQPGQIVQWRWDCRYYWNKRQSRQELIDGHEYALRANPDVFLKAVRWTYGEPGALERIGGRPPIPVSLENEARFTIHKESDPRFCAEWFYSVP